MLSDFLALDLSDDACTAVYLFFLNCCQGFSSAFSACHIRQGTTILAITAFDIVSSLCISGLCMQNTRNVLNKGRCRERHCAHWASERQPNGACLSSECQIGPLPRHQYSLLMQGCGFPEADVSVLCQSPPTFKWSIPRQPVAAPRPMPATAGIGATREGTGHGTGSFVEASVEFGPYKSSPEASCHE